MRQNDPRVKGYYEQFAKSITPQQEQRLRLQYQHAQQREGEQRPYEQWREMSGLPAYFRGYAFQQWKDAAQLYTPEQLKMFDSMMSYLGGTK
jgi:quinol monooxygenase YgiN